MAKKKKLTEEGKKGSKETTKRLKDMNYVRDDLEEYLADCGINCVTPKRVKDTVNDSGDDLEEDLADCSLDYNILVPDEIRSNDNNLRPQNTCQIRNKKYSSPKHSKEISKTLDDSVQILEDEIEDEFDSSVMAPEGYQDDSNCHLIHSGSQPRDSDNDGTQISMDISDIGGHPPKHVMGNSNSDEPDNRIGIIDYSECVSELDASVVILDDNLKGVSDTSDKIVENGVAKLLDRDVDLDASVMILEDNKREAHHPNEPCPIVHRKNERLERDADGQTKPLQIVNQVLGGNETESDLDEDDAMDPNLCDSVNQLLESDEDLDSEDEVRSKEEEVREGEVVWRLWYRGSSTKKRVADVDLTPLPPLVMAQLCLVTGLHKGRGGAVKDVSVVAIPGKEQPVQAGKERKVAARCTRRLGCVSLDRRILGSQTYRRDFSTLRSSFSSVERFLTNHVGCARVAEEERRTAAEYFALDCMERCEYLEGLRRLKQGLPKELPRVPEEARVAEPEVEEDEAEEDVEEEAAEEDESVPAAVAAVEDFLETLEPEAQLLVAGLPPSWPLDLAREPAMLANLKRILTRRKRSRRHEMFLDSRQRDMRSGLPELVRISNPSFLNIFGKRRHRLDAQVRVSLQRSLLGPDSSGRWDTRLGSLMGQSQHLSSQYVELVLYPELFIFWLMGVRGCKYEQADSFYRTTGTLLTRAEKECQIASWLDLGGKNVVEEV